MGLGSFNQTSTSERHAENSGICTSECMSLIIHTLILVLENAASRPAVSRSETEPMTRADPAHFHKVYLSKAHIPKKATVSAR